MPAAILPNVSPRILPITRPAILRLQPGASGPTKHVTQPFACRQQPLPTNALDDTSSNSLNSRMPLFAPALAGLTDIVVSYPGFGLANPEADFPVAYAVTSAIEYPAGTFTPLYVNGSRTLNVTPGRTNARFDPCPIYIPPGAQFWLKSFATWSAGHFWLAIECCAFEVGSWTIRGTNLTDQTLTATAFASTSAYGFTGVVYGRLSSSLASVGIIGDSISASTGDAPHPNTGAVFFDAALNGQIPVANFAKGSDNLATYLMRPDGRRMALRDSITHLIMAHCRNDMGGALATTKANFLTTIAPYLAAGVKVYAATCLPSSTSVDGWVSVAGQTATGPESNRLPFNDWLRTNWQSFGLEGLLDIATVMDPTDSGIWTFDPGATGRAGAGFATLTGGVVSSVVRAGYNGFSSSNGSAYAVSTTVPCVVYSAPGDPGVGARVDAVTNGAGLMSFTVVDGGSGYLVPPMIAPPSAFSADGIHPGRRGIMEWVKQAGFGPGMFV